MFSEPWWAAFLRWYVETEHPWDVALYMEAMAMDAEGFRREIAMRLAPTLERAAANLYELVRACGRLT